MTRAAAAKLLLLVILAFIICLPEFFTLYRVSKVNFLCLPHRTCVPGRQVKKGENGKMGKAEESRENMCDPSQAADHEKWEQTCARDNQSNESDAASDPRRDRNDQKMSWFMCETNGDSYNNSLSSALKLHLEVSVKLQLSDAETLNLTLYGRNNYSFLHLHPLEEEEEEEAEEEEEEKGDDEGQKEALFCCLPLLPTSESSNQSRCLLWLANQTVLTETAKEKLPWKRTQRDEWRCIIRVVWLVLLCSVLLAIVTVVVRDVGKHLRRNSRLRPVGYNLTNQQSNDVQQQTANITPTGGARHTYRLQSWSELSPIQEVDSREDTLLDGNVDHCYNGNLHHRCHSSSLADSHVL